MTKGKMKIGEISKPRFEFRTFGIDLSETTARMVELSMPVPEHVKVRHSDEVYVISKTNDTNNTKIRDGKMDIKTFVQSKDGLEQWNPHMKGEFPIRREILKTNVFPAFQVTMPELSQDEYTLEEFLEIINIHLELRSMSVKKERFGYMVNDTICEVANVVIDNTTVTTISTESTEIPDILQTIEDVGLRVFENINYLQAIKRIIGWINKPLAN
ncbi:MAG: hypothetical protein QGI31_04140 [Dehalococcoidia bacterium]|jgi:hypothetical protein|nr:hypothetical protein [Dehalococcoidia bacterium]MDP7088806.1 hypothetical protein [Dehalococcoidia bacterium]MDP7674010.1 hypothetical protein [Dehalococcoidia bacterium]